MWMYILNAHLQSYVFTVHCSVWRQLKIGKQKIEWKWLGKAKKKKKKKLKCKWEEKKTSIAYAISSNQFKQM